MGLHNPITLKDHVVLHYQIMFGLYRFTYVGHVGLHHSMLRHLDLLDILLGLCGFTPPHYVWTMCAYITTVCWGYVGWNPVNHSMLGSGKI